MDDVHGCTGWALSRYSTSGEDAEWTDSRPHSRAIPQHLVRVILALRPRQEELEG